MEDKQIVMLFWQRDETAITEAQSKYDRYCRTIADNLLHNREDAEECVNDAYRSAWDAIPPHRPAHLSTFLGKITRRLALKRLRSRNAQKRGGGETALPLAELEDCIPSGQDIDSRLDAHELAQVINRFLEQLSADERRVFLRRYWFFDSIEAISTRYGFGQSKVKMMLLRTRKKLLLHLQKEDVYEIR